MRTDAESSVPYVPRAAWACASRQVRLAFNQPSRQLRNLTLELTNSEENGGICFCKSLYFASEPRVAAPAQETASQDTPERPWNKVLVAQFTLFKAKKAPPSGQVDFHLPYTTTLTPDLTSEGTVNIENPLIRFEDRLRGQNPQGRESTTYEIIVCSRK